MPPKVIGRTADKAEWGRDWLSGLLADVAVRTGAWPHTMGELLRGMGREEVRGLLAATELVAE